MAAMTVLTSGCLALFVRVKVHGETAASTCRHHNQTPPLHVR
jgi:hypothetical protein